MIILCAQIFWFISPIFCHCIRTSGLYQRGQYSPGATTFPPVFSLKPLGDLPNLPFQTDHHYIDLNYYFFFEHNMTRAIFGNLENSDLSFWNHGRSPALEKNTWGRQRKNRGAWWGCQLLLELIVSFCRFLISKAKGWNCILSFCRPLPTPGFLPVC